MEGRIARLEKEKQKAELEMAARRGSLAEAPLITDAVGPIRSTRSSLVGPESGNTIEDY